MTDTDFFNPSEHQEAVLDKAGWYTVEIVNVQRKKAGSGTEGYEFQFRILLGKAAGATVRETFWDTPNALGRLGTFTRLFYDGPGFHRSDAKALWSVYAGARLSAEIGFDVRDDGTQGYPQIRRFGRVQDKDRPNLAAIPRFAAVDPPEGILTPKEPRQRRNYGASGGGGGGGRGGDSGYPQNDTSYSGGTQDDDIPF